MSRLLVSLKVKIKWKVTEFRSKEKDKNGRKVTEYEIKDSIFLKNYTKPQP